MSADVCWIHGPAELRQRIEAWLRGGESSTGAARAIPLAASSLREIVRLPAADAAACDVVVKRYRLGSGPHPGRECAKRRLGWSGSQREWRALSALSAAGVACPAPLGFARLADGDELVVQSFAAGRSLREALQQAPECRRACVLALAEAVHALHAAGFAHGDLHAGNALLTEAGVLLLDLQRTRRCAIGSGRQWRDLGLIDHSLWQLGVSRSDRVRAQVRALGLDRSTAAERKPALRRVAGAALAAARRHRRERTRQALRAGDRFAAIRCGVRSGLRLRDSDETSVRQALESAAERATPARQPGAADRASAQAGPLRVHALRTGGPRDAIARLLRGPAGSRSWRAGRALEARGIPCARVLAFADAGRLAFGTPSLVVTLQADRGETFESSASPGERVQLLTRLHATAVAGADLCALEPAPDGSGARLTLASLASLRFPRCLGQGARLRELRRLSQALAAEGAPVELQRRALLRYARALPFRGRLRRRFDSLIRRVDARGTPRSRPRHTRPPS